VNEKKVLQISPTSTNPKVTVNEDGSHKPYTFRACFLDPFHRDDLHARNLLPGRVGFGNDGLREPQLGGFFQPLLAALHRTHFTGQTHLAEHHQLLRQRLVAQR